MPSNSESHMSIQIIWRLFSDAIWRARVLPPFSGGSGHMHQRDEPALFAGSANPAQ